MSYLDNVEIGQFEWDSKFVREWVDLFDDIAACDLELLHSLLCDSLDVMPRFFTKIYRNMGLVMYRGMGAALARAMACSWPTIRDTDKLFDSSRAHYKDRGFLVAAASAVETPGHLTWEAWRRSPEGELFVDVSDSIEGCKHFFELLNGERALDSHRSMFRKVDKLHDPNALFAHLDDLRAAFTRHLMTERDWSGSRAVLAADEMIRFLEYVEQHRCRGKCGDAERNRRLRRLLRAETLLVPDPFVLVEYTILGQDFWMDYRPHAMAALYLAADEWVAWLAENNLAEDKLVAPLRREIQAGRARFVDHLRSIYGELPVVRDLAQ
jgi:hypothetical protein